jgi:hypothetical protein
LVTATRHKIECQKNMFLLVIFISILKLSKLIISFPLLVPYIIFPSKVLYLIGINSIIAKIKSVYYYIAHLGGASLTL